jgi:hypothetical protein
VASAVPSIARFSPPGKRLLKASVIGDVVATFIAESRRPSLQLEKGAIRSCNHLPQ